MGNIPPSALRAPPPRRCSEGSVMGGTGDPPSSRIAAPTTRNEEGNGSRVRSRPYYFRRCKSKSVNSTNIDSLPEELLSEILVRLSADDIYDKARVVCRRWYHLIRTDAFAYAHLHRSSSGLLLGQSFETSMFMAATQGRNGNGNGNGTGIEISNLSYKFRFPTRASCNGLVMGIDFHKKFAPYIVNPSTKCPFSLPKFFDRTDPGYFGIAYAAASMEYKVVATYRPDMDKPVLVQCCILTVGVDSAWRHVSIHQLSPRTDDLLIKLLIQTPKITRGFMHWGEGADVVTLNVETEIMTETPAPLLPPDYQDSANKYLYLSTERYLSLLICRGEFSWQAWEMKPESGEWRKLLPNIDLEAHKCRIKQFACKSESNLRPVGWVRYPELLAFFLNGAGCSCIIYNLHMNEIDCIKLPSPACNYNPIVHRNSLVWLS